MSDLPKHHGWTHRPKAKGGTDPVEMELPFAFASRDTNQTIDNDAEIVILSGFITNRPDIFSLDPAGEGILVIGNHTMQIYGMTEAAGHITTARETYTQAQPESSYPTFGTEYGGLSFGWALDTSLLDNTNTRQTHIGLGTVGGSAADPGKAVLVARRLGGVNYNVTRGSLWLVRIADYYGP